MPRMQRVVIAGMPHHITHRGNRKQNVFLDDADRMRYLRLLTESVTVNGVRVWAYALMSNHVHLICVPKEAEGLSVTCRQAHGLYASYFNARHGLVGHLWQNRFHSAVLDATHLMRATRYVEQNPVRAGIVEHSENYRWSSARAHCERHHDQLLSNDFPLLTEIENWTDWLREAEAANSLEAMRWRTHRGYPIGSNKFIRELELRTGRSIGLPRRTRLGRCTASDVAFDGFL